MPLGIAIAAMSMRFTKLVKRPRLPFLAQDTVDAVFSSASISALPQRFCHRPLQGSSGDRKVIHYRHAITWWIDVLAKRYSCAKRQHLHCPYAQARADLYSSCEASKASPAIV